MVWMAFVCTLWADCLRPQRVLQETSCRSHVRLARPASSRQLCWNGAEGPADRQMRQQLIFVTLWVIIWVGCRVEILFKKRKFAKECNSSALLIQRNGPRRAQLIRRRLDELHAAVALEDLRDLPGPRCHELRENRAGQLSVDLDYPYRLILEPANAPLPLKPDGGLDWTKVTSVRVLEIADTHE
jgi:plasmid maintenance system killer protein